MSEAILAAGAGGTLTAIIVWQVLRRFWHQFRIYEVQQRLQRLTSKVQAPVESTAALPLRDFRYSVLPFLDWIVRRFSMTPKIALFLQQAGSKLNVGSYVLIHLVSVAVVFFVASWFRLPWLIKAPLLITAGIVPFMIVAYRRQKRLRLLMEQLPDAIRLISSSLRAGLGLDVGLNAVVSELSDPIRAEFRQLVNESLMEFNMNDAFRRFAKRVPLSDYQLFAAASCLHREVGGNFAELLDALEETVRERFRLYRELSTMTAMARFERSFLVALPILTAFGLHLMNPSHFTIFWEDPMGQKLFWGVVALQVLGVTIISWMTRIRIQ